MKKGLIALLSILMVLSIVLAGCGSGNSTQKPDKTTQTTSDEPVTGSIVAAGSTALQPFVEQAANDFMAKNSGASITVQGGGSGKGLSMVSDGSVDIGNSDLFANEKLDATQSAALTDHKVAVVGFATIVNPKINIDNLSKQQLVDIFTGKITNWKDVNGPDQKIVVVNRPESSGTRATFKKYALDGKEEAQGLALTEDSSGTVLKSVADTPGAVSYLALSYVNSTVKALKLDGVDPTAENIESGAYPIWSYEHMYTKGEATGLSKAFLDFIDKNEKSTIKSMGYIAISDMKTSR